uniref:Peroxisomal biogenesis factor 11 n=1 Tax=Hemiselmis andersenii TaxID=464988 RepID=A0A6U2BFP1_HEMAN|mmetsp:Transcript_16391/g.37879  ORF Transcript_16391/g.37879 Transcript_16391/m.37879 type:complete len:239 (+) Transcript_16391:130-846(+)|eukprot:CAMPEP_0114133158 /NCGR_PEP_ID=MMETSP0043_2-20121206/13476_1 /TAXON_ID=464988 /ORGANISM="Hemiselmis andersenii, Strain CCMP644" /LENGTH=238 /DNA_ID=CAMNT_0001226715 /DNA_START=84 /DNA_END=800 /DNA_ORIENTATION=+
MERALAVNNQWVKYAARVDGRDKLCRSVAYGSEFVLWLFSRSGSDVLKRWMKQVKNVKSGVGVARKCFRFAAPLKDLDAVANMKEKGTPATMKTILHTFNAIYYFIDSIELLSIFQILPYNPPEVKRIRYRFWIVKTFMNISLAFMAFSKARRNAAKVQKENAGDPEAVKAGKKQVYKAYLQLIVALTDIPVMFHNTSDWGKKKVPAHVMGASGAFGSLISCSLIWMEVGASLKAKSS